MRNGARHKSYWKSNKNTDKSSTAKDCIPQKQYFRHISATEDLSIYAQPLAHMHCNNSL